MDTAGILSSRPDQSISIYKQKIRNPRRRMNPSQTNENLAPSNHQINGRGDGILMRPPQRSFSFSTQPPLLPLPISKPYSSSSSSLPPKSSSINKKPLTQKWPNKSLDASKRSQSSPLVSKSAHRLDREHDPNLSNKMISDDDDDVVSGWIYSLAPPPSSLPIPKFSAKPKAGCNIEAATRIDSNATSNLMKLLHLC